MTTTTQGPETGQAHVIARLADAAGDALDRVTDAPARSMTADEQRAVLVGLTRAQARIAEVRLRVLAAGDNNDIGKDTAASSTAAWLAHATRQTRALAHSDVRRHPHRILQATRAASGDASHGVERPHLAPAPRT